MSTYETNEEGIPRPRVPPKALRKSPDGASVIVVDTAPLIRAPQAVARQGHLFAVPEVLAEIKDPTTRTMYDLYCSKTRTENPTAEDMRYVRAYAKATGDVGSLSEADLRVAGLAVKLTREFLGAEALNTHVPGAQRVRAQRQGLEDLTLDPKLVKRYQDTMKKAEGPKTDSTVSDDESPSTVPSSDVVVESKTVDDALSESAECEDFDSEEYEYYCSDEDDDDDENAWITPENVHLLGEQHATEASDDAATDDGCTPVYCVTNDFALQNILLSMGVRLKSVHGYSIKSIKSWGKLCRCCSQFIRDATKRFCTRCGSYMLRKVAYERGSDGQVKILDTRRTIVNKGLNTSLPKPAQGKSGQFKQELILCEDQLLTQSMQWRIRRAEKERQKQITEATDPYASAGLGVGAKARSNLAAKWEVDFQVAMGHGNPNSKVYHRRNQGRRAR